MKPTVRTFDVFDTLLARRCIGPKEVFQELERDLSMPGFANRRVSAEARLCGKDYALKDIYREFGDQTLAQHEIEAEARNIFAVREIVAQIRPGDLLVSEMYLPFEFLRELIDRLTALSDCPLFATTWGKSTGRIWKILSDKYEIIEHTGDNPHLDFRIPARYGIRAKLISISSFTAEEKELCESGFTALAKTMRETRLTTFDAEPVKRRLQLLQSQVNFPMLFLASLLLHRRVTHQKISTVLMSSRDCFLWFHMQNRLRVLAAGKYRVVYFLTSRIARRRPSARYLQYLNQFLKEPTLIVDLCGSGFSLQRLMAMSAAPSTSIFMLIRYRDSEGAPTNMFQVLLGNSGTMDNADVIEKGNLIEKANLAAHPMVIDVTEEFAPVYLNATGTRWDQLAEIRLQHQTFFRGLEVSLNYDFSEDLECNDNRLVRAIETCYKRLAGYKEQFTFTEPFWEVEERSTTRILCATHRYWWP